MTQLVFSTTGCWDQVQGFGCASLGLPGKCDNTQNEVAAYPIKLEGEVLIGTYAEMLQKAAQVAAQKMVYAAVVVFGNVGGENVFLAQLQKIVSCPMVGGGAAVDGPTGRSGLIPGDGPGAVFLITDSRYHYQAVTQCIHDEVLEICTLTVADPRTILTINGEDAALFLSRKKAAYGLADSDFEHLTLSDLRGVNAHLSIDNGIIKSGRDVHEQMILRYVSQDKVYDAMSRFYDDPNAIVFGCAGLAGLLDRPLNTDSLGLFLFGEVCTVDGVAEFGNLMLSKLLIEKV